MNRPTLTATSIRSAGPAAPRLVVLPSLGTGVTTLWQQAVSVMSTDATVVGVDLPGHGHSPAPPPEEGISWSIAELAGAVLASVDSALTSGGPLVLAGDSVGGAIALQLAVDYPDRIAGVGVFCSAAKLGEAQAWEDRAALVERAGTPTQVTGSAGRWFAPGFIAAHPAESTALLKDLQEADRFGYAGVCRALAAFDLREEVGTIGAPVLAVAGAEDAVTPPAGLEFIAEAAPRGRFDLVANAAHQVPLEQPAEAARLLDELLRTVAEGPGLGSQSAGSDGRRDARYAAGMAVRREVLGDAHVDRAQEGTTDFTRDFQDLITRYAWGEIWTRPGLDRRMRSAVTLTAMIAGGHHDELAMHVRAALRNGLSQEEIGEILLQSAVYCSVPSANTAFGIAQRVFDEM